jgi:hypothetical protein
MLQLQLVVFEVHYDPVVIQGPFAPLPGWQPWKQPTNPETAADVSKRPPPSPVRGNQYSTLAYGLISGPSMSRTCQETTYPPAHRRPPLPQDRWCPVFPVALSPWLGLGCKQMNQQDSASIKQSLVMNALQRYEVDPSFGSSGPETVHIDTMCIEK